MYEINYYTWFRVIGIGTTICFAISGNDTFTNIMGVSQTSIATGVLTYSTPSQATMVNRTAARSPFPNTGTLTLNGTFYSMNKFHILNNGASSVTLAISSAAGGIQPLSGSYGIITRIA